MGIRIWTSWLNIRIIVIIPINTFLNKDDFSAYLNLFNFSECHFQTTFVYTRKELKDYSWVVSNTLHLELLLGLFVEHGALTIWIWWCKSRWRCIRSDSSPPIVKLWSCLGSFCWFMKSDLDLVHHFTDYNRSGHKGSRGQRPWTLNIGHYGNLWCKS